MIFAGLTPERVCADFLSAERYQAWCDQIWSTDRRSGLPRDRSTSRAGAVVYAKADHTTPLFQQLRKSRSRIVLVTAESDVTIDEALAATKPPQVGAWFSTNAESSRVRPLPLGLGNSYCEVTNKAAALAEALGKSGPRDKLLYVNFRPSSNPALREPLLANFSARSQGHWLAVRTEAIAPPDFLREMTQHKFVLCPAGNGIDSHRIWEALYTGTIPVVQNNSVFRDFASLPILFVDDLAEVNEGLLEHAWAEMNRRTWSLDLLFAPAWQEQVAGTKKTVSGDRACLGVREYIFARLSRRATGKPAVFP
jgi:hypothetical protein